MKTTTRYIRELSAALVISAVFMGCAMPQHNVQAVAYSAPSHDIHFY